MKKIALFLAAVMLLAFSVACASGGGNVQTSGTGSPGNADTDPYADAVPKNLKYDGYDFVMCFPNPADHGMDLQIVEEGAVVSAIDDSIWKRNRQIEERFSITLSGYCAGNSDTQTSFLQQAAQSGDDSMDLAFIAFTFSGLSWISTGYAMPWNNVDYVDTDRVYWNDSSISNLSIAGKYFLLQGDINWPSMMSTQVVFFNTVVAEDNRIENLYDSVWDNTWTFNKMLNLIKPLNRDLNNDGVFDETDQYGATMCYYGATYEIGIAANYVTVLTTEDDGFQLNVSTNKFADIVQFAYDLINGEGRTYCEPYDYIYESKGIPIFFEDRALFHFDGLGAGDEFRNEKSDYGIIPWPKWDENQEKYCTTNDQWGLSCSLPTTASDPSRTGAITEALCALSGKLVYPTYYEVVLSVRNTRDEESKAMLDLIFENVIYDPGIAFGTFSSYIPLYNLVKTKSTNIASWAAKYGPKLQTKFDEVFAFVTENFK
ncbi:MAG: hypothetical protein J5563_04560 [Clostridia bacterium]|nr:hypothetical protein [Clostridia bacterium]